MIKTLLKLQLISLFHSVFRTSSGKKRGVGFKIFIGILAVYVVAVLLVSVGLMFLGMAQMFPMMGITWLYWGFAAALCVLASFIFTVFMSNGTLFEAKDNELLMSMPIKPRHILLTRMFSLYLAELLFALLVMLPATVVFILFAPAAAAITPFGLLCVIAGTLLLPMLALALATVVGWLIGLISSRMRHKNIITAVLMVILFIGFFIVYMNIYGFVQQLAESGLAFTEIFKTILPFTHFFGLAVAEGSLLHLLLFLLWCILPVALVYTVLSRNFVKIATTNRGAAKIKYVEKPMKVSSLRGALLRKELARFTSLPTYMFNMSIGLVLLLLYSGFMLIRGKGIISMLATGVLVDFGLFLDETSINSFLSLFAAVIILFCVITNLPSAVSLSLEGKNLWILRSSPLRFGDVIFAKAGLTVLLGFPFILLSVAATAVVIPMTAIQIAGFLLLPLSAQLFIALFSFTVNLWFPKFEFNSPAQITKQSASAIISVFAAMAFLAIPIVLFFLVFIAVDPNVYLFYTSLCFIVLSGLTLLYLNTGGKKIYDSINV